jgi:hypothetical protein
VREDPEEGVVRYAATESTSARIPMMTRQHSSPRFTADRYVQNAERLRTSRRVKADILLAMAEIVNKVRVAFRTIQSRVVVHIEVPTQLLIFGDCGLEGGDGVVQIGALVITGLEKQHAVPCARKPTGKRAAASSTADDNVLVREVGGRWAWATGGINDRCAEYAASETNEEAERTQANHGRLKSECSDGRLGLRGEDLLWRIPRRLCLLI